MCTCCRRAIRSLIGEAEHRQGHDRPRGYHRLDEILDVLTATGLEDEAARVVLALMSWRCRESWAHRDTWTTRARLCYVDGREGPARLRDLGAVPILIEGLFPDQTLDDDEQIVVYTVEVPLRPCPGAPHYRDIVVGPIGGPDDTQRWYRDGVPHRDDGPAVVHLDGSVEWYRDGLRHRTDGPAVERVDGHREWWIRGQFQRRELAPGERRTVLIHENGSEDEGYLDDGGFSDDDSAGEGGDGIGADEIQLTRQASGPGG